MFRVFGAEGKADITATQQTSTLLGRQYIDGLLYISHERRRGKDGQEGGCIGVGGAAQRQARQGFLGTEQASISITTEQQMVPRAVTDTLRTADVDRRFLTPHRFPSIVVCMSCRVQRETLITEVDMQQHTLSNQLTARSRVIRRCLDNQRFTARLACFSRGRFCTLHAEARVCESSCCGCLRPRCRILPAWDMCTRSVRACQQHRWTRHCF